MLEKVWSYGSPHRIKYKINSFSASQFCGRYKVAIPRNQNNLVDLLFVCKRSYVNSYFHIDAFLNNINLKIGFG